MLPNKYSAQSFDGLSVTSIFIQLKIMENRGIWCSLKTTRSIFA